MKQRIFLVLLALCCLTCSGAYGTKYDKNHVPKSVQFLRKMFNMPPESNGNGVTCVGCTLVVALIGQLAEVHNQTVEEVVDELCDYLPQQFATECQYFVNTFGVFIIELLETKASPDEACFAIDLCTNQTCSLFPKSSKTKTSRKSSRNGAQFARMQVWKANGGKHPIKVQEEDNMKWEWPWDRIIDHKPVFDGDNDLFSTHDTLRGYHWRGADCNDFDPNIYPGRRISTYPDDVDHNCNGIYGHTENGTSYEDLFCKGTPQFSTIILGDSAAAHFHVPPQYITSKEITKDTYSDALYIMEDEFDWPMMSSATGYTNMNTTWVGYPSGPVASQYLMTRELNRCVHRDYQNIGVNGARTSSMLSDIIKTVARNQKYDQPAFVVYALIGNDVCNGHYGTSHMTTPTEFYQNVVGAMEFLDTVLAPGSHVAFVGLADGRLLYDSMGHRIHPIGSLHNDVTYSQFYDYFNCLQVSPCFGWMNSDAYWRNATTERANELNKVYGEIIANHTFKNFDMTYFENPLEEVVQVWKAQGGESWQLIEPVDGFHPNQLADALAAEVIWKKYQEKGLLPPTNPYNEEIEKIFGDQVQLFGKHNN